MLSIVQKISGAATSGELLQISAQDLKEHSIDQDAE